MEYKANFRDLVSREEYRTLISQVEMEFYWIQDKKIIVSQKITIPGIDATWWLEIHPTHANSSFPNAENQEMTLLPDVKVMMQFHDETIYTSNLFSVTIDIVEWRNKSVSGHCGGTTFENYKHLSFYEDFNVNINSEILEVSNGSSKKSNKAYYFKSDDYRDTSATTTKYLQLNLRCKLTFKFIGELAESFTDAVKQLKSLASKSFGNLLDDDSYSDFTIVAGEKSFKVHKCILANASSVFKTMFTCGLDETKFNSATVKCKPETMQSFLEFIYEGALPSYQELKSAEFCCEFYELTDRYELKILKEINKSYALQIDVNPENALKVYEFASTYEFKSLLDTSWEIIKTKLLDIKKPCQPKPLPIVKEVLNKLAEHREKWERTKQRFIREANSNYSTIE